MKLTETNKIIIILAWNLIITWVLIYVNSPATTKPVKKEIIKEHKYSMLALKKKFPWMNKEIYYIVREEAERNNLDAAFICSVIHEESGRFCYYDYKYMKRVRGTSGEYGLMQVMPFHYKRNPSALHNPRINVRIGAKYLARCLRKARYLGFKNPYKEAARMYNGGLYNQRYKYRRWAYVNRIDQNFRSVRAYAKKNDL